MLRSNFAAVVVMGLMLAVISARATTIFLPKDPAQSLQPAPSYPPAVVTPGRYLQAGAQDIAPEEPGPLQVVVIWQIELASQEECERRLVQMKAQSDLGELVGTGGIWCSATSASEKLKVSSTFRHRVTGKSLVVETEDVASCQEVVAGFTGGQNANEKVEVWS